MPEEWKRLCGLYQEADGLSIKLRTVEYKAEYIEHDYERLARLLNITHKADKRARRRWHQWSAYYPK